MAKPKSKYQPTPKGGAKHYSVTVPNSLLKRVTVKAMEAYLTPT